VPKAEAEGMKPAPGTRRAPKGSVASALLLRLPVDLRRRLDRAARAGRLSAAEYVRRALAVAVEREES
jgi:hypothetical protein